MSKPSTISVSLRRFDLYPNRGRDLAYQPRTPRSLNESMLDGPVQCRHGEDWMKCGACSQRRSKP
jgi:hypothetical protein